MASSSSGNIFAYCSALHDGGGEDATTKIMECISDTYQESSDSRNDNLRSFLLVVCGGMIFFMQSGFAMMCAGSVRLKNVQNTMLKNLLDACGAALAFYLVGRFYINAIHRNSCSKDSGNGISAPACFGTSCLALHLFLYASRFCFLQSPTIRIRIRLWWRPLQ
jgi:hypothetical protein